MRFSGVSRALLGKKDFGGMTAYWIFQFLGAFGASYTYKLAARARDLRCVSYLKEASQVMK